jgi:hypothetical protein
MQEEPGSQRMRVAFEARILQRANNSLFRWNDRDAIALTDRDAALGFGASAP